jgi:Pyruvate/2-oxoacid:ferredoxin oxidoreductase delta subunit/thioredoxin reductase
MEKRPRQLHKVAIVGAGPAGLSAAWFLSMLGYPCDIFESLPEAGGILRWGIPEYRLPLAVLRVEIARIEKQGVRIFSGKPVSLESLNELKKDYRAVFLGCGYSSSTPLGITGETPESVKDGLAFLRKVRQGETPSCQGLSAVIGGGNTAVDLARTIIRLGGKAIILYRRRRQDMPAFENEVVMALEEGVELNELLSPESIQPYNGRYRLTSRRMKIEGQDQDGRGRIVPISETMEMEVECVFTATGADAAKPWHKPSIDQINTMVLSHCTLLFEDGSHLLAYVGDTVNTTKNVTHAIASGKQAAMALDTFFHKGMDAIEDRLAGCRVGSGPALSMEIYMGGPRGFRSPHVVKYEEINTDYFQFEPRMTQPRLLAEERCFSFDEIDLRISANISIREAGRCFNCGLCNQCDNCYFFCPDVAVKRGWDMNDRHIDYDYCKGCGLCAAECPRNAVTLGKEDV